MLPAKANERELAALSRGECPDDSATLYELNDQAWRFWCPLCGLVADYGPSLLERNAVVGAIQRPVWPKSMSWDLK